MQRREPQRQQGPSEIHKWRPDRHRQPGTDPDLLERSDLAGLHFNDCRRACQDREGDLFKDEATETRSPVALERTDIDEEQRQREADRARAYEERRRITSDRNDRSTVEIRPK